MLLSVLDRHVLICSCDQHTDPYPWVCGLVSVVDFAFPYVATDSIARRRPRLPLALREGTFCGHGCCGPRMYGVLSFVMEHVRQTCPRASWVGFSSEKVNTKAHGRVKVFLYGSAGYEAFQRKLQGPLAGPSHNSSVFDSVRLMQHEPFARKERAGLLLWQRHRHWPPFTKREKPKQNTQPHAHATRHTLSRSHCEKPGLLQQETLRQHTISRL